MIFKTCFQNCHERMFICVNMCSHLTSAFAFASMSPSKFNIASMVMQTQTHRMGSEPILYINVNLTVTLMQTQTQTSSVNKALDTCLSGSGDDVYIHEALHVALHRGLVSSSLLVDTLYGPGLPVRPVYVVTVLKQVFTFYHDLSPKLWTSLW